MSRSGGGDGGKRLLGFVGVYTGFGSADRRAALRSTWFPSDPDRLVKYGSKISSCFARFVVLDLLNN